MIPSTNSHFRTVTATVLALALIASPPTQASVISKPLIWIGKKLGKKATSTVIKDATKTATQKELRYITRKFGPDIAARTESIAQRTGFSRDLVVSELRRFGHAYKRAGFADEAIQFGIKHGQAGRYLVSHEQLWTPLKKAGALNEGNTPFIRQSWRIVAGTGGSWARLRQEVTAAEKAGSLQPPFSRDFCEALFSARVKAGGLRDITGTPVFPKGTELISGHIPTPTGETRQGLDYLLPQKNGPLQVIEFGTGRKPESPDELSWDRIRDRLARFVETAANKDQLRAAGMPPDLMNPANIRDPHFPIHKYTSRTVIAPDINIPVIKKTEQESPGAVRYAQLP